MPEDAAVRDDVAAGVAGAVGKLPDGLRADRVSGCSTQSTRSRLVCEWSVASHPHCPWSG